MRLDDDKAEDLVDELFVLGSRSLSAFHLLAMLRLQREQRPLVPQLYRILLPRECDSFVVAYHAHVEDVDVVELEMREETLA